MLADAAAVHEDLGLQQKVRVPGFALDVVNNVLILDVGVKSKNHLVVNL